MAVKLLGFIYSLLFASIISPCTSYGQNKSIAHISGNLSIDNSWDSIIYLSHIPTYDDMYVMSNEMILAETVIDSLGNFNFYLDFLPKEEKIYRLHIIKKEDTPATLIIGGKNENHFFLIANCYSNIHLNNNSQDPPFKSVTFKNSIKNNAFQLISQLVFKADSMAAESSASKRLLIEEQLHEDLLSIADTSNNFLVSLFAIYKSKYESNYTLNIDFYKAYIKKWNKQNNPYFKAFKKKLTFNSNTNSIVIAIILTFIFMISGFFLGKRGFKNKKIKNLSIQERKIFELLKQGATNQEISNDFNIGLSTVKSHVSSIYSKLNIKSRKDIVNMK